MNSKRIELFALSWSVLLLSAPALVYAIAGNIVLRYSDVDTLARFALLPFSIGILLFVLAVVGSRLFMWITLPLSLLAQFETFNVLVMKKPSTIGTIGSMMDTNSREFFEIVGANVPFVILGIALLGIHMMIFLTTRKHIQKTSPLRFRILILIIGLCLSIPEAILIGTLPWSSEYKLAMLKMDVKDTFPFGTLFKSVHVFQTKYNLACRSISIRSFDWKPNRKANPAVPETYVVIIGESSRSGNWSLYGYDKPTTPRLREKQDQLLVFKDMTSGAAFTTESVPMYLTLSTPENMQRFDSTSSILSCFRQSGFKTWWLSTQGRFGGWDVKPSMIGKEADKWSFLNIDPGDENHP